MPIQIQIPFAIDANGRVAVVTTDADADRINLLTLINTQPGERAMRPTYGVATRSLLFEHADLVLSESVASDIEQAVATYAPEIELVDARITGAQDQAFNEGRISISLVFKPGAGRLDTGESVLTTTLADGG